MNIPEPSFDDQFAESLQRHESRGSVPAAAAEPSALAAPAVEQEQVAADEAPTAARRDGDGLQTLIRALMPPRAGSGVAEVEPIDADGAEDAFDGIELDALPHMHLFVESEEPFPVATVEEAERIVKYLDWMADTFSDVPERADVTAAIEGYALATAAEPELRGVSIIDLDEAVSRDASLLALAKTNDPVNVAKALRMAGQTLLTRAAAPVARESKASSPKKPATDAAPSREVRDADESFDDGFERTFQKHLGGRGNV